MELISNSSTYCTPKMQISPTRIWTPVLTSQKTYWIPTLCRMIRYHPERNHQVTANSPTVHGVLGFLMSPISIILKTVWAGKFRWMRELDSNFMSQVHWDSIHSITGVFRWCGCFQVPLRIQRMIPRWKSMVLRHWIPQWRVWCMLSGQRGRSSTGCGAPDDSDCKAMDDQAVVKMETRQWRMTSADTRGECTHHWSRVDGGRPSTFDDPGGEVHFAGCFWSMEGS